MIENSPQQKMKSFWKRPEGVTGAIFLIGLIVVIAVFSVQILAFIQSLFATLFTMIAFFVVLGIIVYVLLDPKFRALIWYMYKSIMRWFTSLFVQIDPIGILKSYIEYLYNNLKEMNTQIAKLKGQISKLSRLIDNNRREMEENLKMAEQAKKKGNMELVAINTRQYGRLKETNSRYTALLNKIQLLYKVLSKIHKNSGYLIKDTENEVRMREQERKAIRAGHSAMKSAMNIISGDPDRKMMFDMATEAIVEDVHNKIGEMERFIEVSGSFIDSIDLQNGVYEQDGLDILEKMEKEGMSFLLGDKVADLNDEKEVEEDVQKDIGNLSNYSNLFD
jgi:phage shock protein A